jgi:hypothetical protein
LIGRLIRDLVLLVGPFCILSVLFFIGEQPRYGIAFAIVALAALWYVRPHHADRSGGASGDGGEDSPLISPHGGGGIGGGGI